MFFCVAKTYPIAIAMGYMELARVYFTFLCLCSIHPHHRSDLNIFRMYVE